MTSKPDCDSDRMGCNAHIIIGLYIGKRKQMLEPIKISSGIDQFDRLIDGLYIGDNVVWHDNSGSLAALFFLNFLKISKEQQKPLIYVSFDRSPKNLLDKLGTLADYADLILLDCFTYGKGKGSTVFLKFYENRLDALPCRIQVVENPSDPARITEALDSIHRTLDGDVRFIFESLTGMQELWGGEDEIAAFYSHTCPRLYELSTVAYWIMEKRAHSARLRAQINQIAQVAIDLSVKRGSTSLSVIKAEKRDLKIRNRPFYYWNEGLTLTFDLDKRSAGRLDLGGRLKSLRLKSGFSQKELARLVGVTPSSISQVEGNLTYPSLPALLKIAEVLRVPVSSIFQNGPVKKTGWYSPQQTRLKLNAASPAKRAFRCGVCCLQISWPGQSLTSLKFHPAPCCQRIFSSIRERRPAIC